MDAQTLRPFPSAAMRDNPRPMTDETASAAAQLAPAHADAIEIFAEVLAQSEDEGLGDDFYSRLCEGITRCTALRRVVIFRYDSDAPADPRRRQLRRRPRAASPATSSRSRRRRSRARRSSRIACSRVSDGPRPASCPREYVERLARAHRRLLADVGARALARRDPRRPRRRRAAADRVRARGAVDPRQDGRARGDGAGRDAPARARRRARAAHRPRARGARGRRAAAVRRLARALRRPAVRRGDAAALRRGGAGGARRPAHRDAAAARALGGGDAGRRSPRRSRGCAHEYPDLGIDAEGDARSRRRQPLEPLAQSVLAEAIRNAAQARPRHARRRAHRDATTARSCSR